LVPLQVRVLVLPLLVLPWLLLQPSLCGRHPHLRCQRRPSHPLLLLLLLLAQGLVTWTGHQHAESPRGWCSEGAAAPVE
jgi:hypothetical protein